MSPKNAGKSPAKSAEVFEMSAAVEALDLIKEIAGPQEVGAKIKVALGQVVRQTGLSHRRVRGLWNSEARAIRAEELDALRRAAKKANTNEIKAFAARLAAVEARLTSIDPEFHSEHVDALRSLHDRMGRLAKGDGR